MALMFLQVFICGILDLAAEGNLVQRPAHNIAVLGNGLKDALADPPDGIGDELEATCLVELFSCGDEPDVTFVDEVGERDTFVLLLLGHRHDEAQVGSDELVFCSLSHLSSFSDSLG